jgi:hypothetical protein
LSENKEVKAAQECNSIFLIDALVNTKPSHDVYQYFK